MAERPDFDVFYDVCLRSCLEAFEPERRAISRYLWTGAVVLAAVFAILGLALGPQFGSFSWPFVGFYWVTFVGAIWQYQERETRQYRLRFKNAVISEMIKALQPGLEYQPEGTLAKAVFENSGLIGTPVDRWLGDDLVRGAVGATALEFCDLMATRVSADSDGRETSFTVFQGLFIAADFHKHFRGRTYVFSDKAESVVGRALGRTLQSWTGPGTLVALEDPRFESEFVVYSTDPQEARYLLSPALMERILRFQQACGRRVQLSFVDSSMFVSVPFDDGLFEAPMGVPATDRRAARAYYETLRLGISMVDELGLNTRIWTKA